MMRSIADAAPARLIPISVSDDVLRDLSALGPNLLQWRRIFAVGFYGAAAHPEPIN